MYKMRHLELQIEAKNVKNVKCLKNNNNNNNNLQTPRPRCSR